MAVFKFVIGNSGKSCQIEKDQKDCEKVVGMKIGSRFDASFLGLEGYELQITGGTDRDGFSMKPGVEGPVKKRLLVSQGTGFSGFKKIKKKYVKIKGIRKKKMLRGNTIDRSMVQVNCKVVKSGPKPLEELVAKKEDTEKKE